MAGGLSSVHPNTCSEAQLAILVQYKHWLYDCKLHHRPTFEQSCESHLARRKKPSNARWTRLRQARAHLANPQRCAMFIQRVKEREPFHMITSHTRLETRANNARHFILQQLYRLVSFPLKQSSTRSSQDGSTLMYYNGCYPYFVRVQSAPAFADFSTLEASNHALGMDGQNAAWRLCRFQFVLAMFACRTNSRRVRATWHKWHEK